MPKVKPEKIAGIVALSYLVLIPVGALLAYQKIHRIDQDVSAMWETLMPDQDPAPVFLDKLRGFAKR